MQENILELKNITKRYPGVVALDNIQLEVKKGTVHALLGENGAGKSTLIKTIAGAIEPNEGTIIFEGKKYSRLTPRGAMDLGIGVIYQEFNLIPYLTVADNIFLGNEETKLGKLNDKKATIHAKKLLDDLDIHVDPRQQVKTLSVGYQQLVEIVKAVSKKTKLLIMDEPTAALSEKEVEKLLALVKRLRDSGMAIVYISHRIEELFEIADEITVMRDGRYIDTLSIAECERCKLISMMVGREMGENYPQGCYATDEVVLKAENLTNEKIDGVSFELYKGEILGFGGLVGAGRTEVARAIFGADKLMDGKITLFGKEIKINTPKDAVENGMAFITEDRKQQGLLMKLNIRENISVASLKKLIKRWPSIDKKTEKKIGDKYCAQLAIKTPSPEQLVKNLSGGNQQKVVLAKWLLTDSKIIIFDEPTRGIDVGVKFEFYQIMKDLAKQGISIIMISSEMPELIGMSDRVLVMNAGHLAGELSRKDASQQAILDMATCTM